MINTIILTPTARGYHGKIGGRLYGLSDPQLFLEIANVQFPHLLFEVVIK